MGSPRRGGLRTVEAQITGGGIDKIVESLSSAGVEEGAARAIGESFSDLSGDINKVKIEWRDLAETGEQVTRVTVSGVDKTGAAISETVSHIREVNDAGEETWRIVKNGSATLDYVKQAANEAKAVAGAIQFYSPIDTTTELQEQINALNGVGSEYKNAAESAKVFIDAQKSSAAILKSSYKTIDDYYAALKKLNGTDVKQDDSGKYFSPSGRFSAHADYANLASAAYHELESDVSKLNLTLEDHDKLIAYLNKRQLEFRMEAENGFKGAGEAAGKFGSKLGDIASKLTSLFSITRVIMAVVRELKKMVQASIEVDSSMNQLQIVTKESDSVMKQFGETAAKTAKEISASMTDIIDSATVFARLGYNLDESALLSKYTAMLKNVGDIDVGSAQNAVTAIVKAFDIDVDEIESVMDKLVTTGNNFPISVSQIAEGMNNASSVLASTGNTFEQSVALLTAANTTIQNASKASTGLRTLAARITKTKTELDDLGEEMTDAQYDALVKSLTDANVALKNANGEFRSTYEIMSDIAAKWDTLTSMEQTALAQALSGTRQQAIFYSIITQFKEASGAMDAMSNSAGSLDVAYATYLDSAAAHIDRFKASFQELSTNIADGKIVSTIVDLGTGVLNLGNTLQKTHTLLIAIIGTLVTLRGLMFAKNVTNLSSQLIAQKGVTESLATSVAKLSVQEKAALKTKIQQAIVSGQLTKTEGDQIIATLGLSTAEGGLVATTKALAVSFKELMASIPVWGWIALGITVVLDVIMAVSTAVGNAEDAITSLDTEFNQLLGDVQSASNEFLTLRDSFGDTVPRFIELSKGVDEFGNNISLTSDEYKEFVSLNNKVAEMFPEINAGLDSNGKYMLTLSYSADALTESLNALLEKQREYANESVADKIDDALDNIKSAQRKYNKEINNLQSSIEASESAIWSMQFYQPGEFEDGWVESVTKEYQDQIDRYNKQIALIQDKAKARWQKLNPFMNAWLQTTDDFATSSDEMQNVLQKLFGNIDYSEIGITSRSGLENYLQENILGPITSATPEVQSAILGVFDFASAFNSGQINMGEFNITDYILGGLQESGEIGDALLHIIDSTLHISEYSDKLNELQDNITVFAGSGKAVTDYLSSLSKEDFDIAYEIYAKNGSMNLDELQEKMKQLRYDNADWVTPLDFGEFASGLDKAASGVDKITKAMANLKKGTALTAGEMLELAQTYPELLKFENIFAEGNVTAQRDALNAILKMREQEYDKTVDAKIAELEATQAVIDQQLDLEKQKGDIINEIAVETANGQIDTADELVEKINEFNDLQKSNYVTMENGILKVNEEALADNLEEQSEFGEESTNNIWLPFANVIKVSHEKGLSAGLEAVSSWIRNMYTKVSNFISGLGSAVANALKDMFSGNWKGIGSYFGAALSGLGNTTASAGNVTVEWTGSTGTINGHSIDDWVLEQKKASDKRIEELNKIKADTKTAIDNLRSLKGLDLGKIYEDTSGSNGSGSKGNNGGSGSSSKSSSWFEQEYKLHKHYLKMDMETTEEYLEWLDKAYKQAYNDGAITLEDYWKYEEEVYDGLRDLFEDFLNDTEHEIELRKRFDGESKNIIALYKKMISAVEKELDTARKRGLDNNNEWVQKLIKQYTSYTDAIKDLEDEVRDNAKSSLDKLLDIRKDMIKQDLENEKDANSKKLDLLREFYDKQKEMLQDEYDEEKYLEEQKEKRKKVSDLQQQIVQLQYDDSAWAQKRRLEIEQELIDAKKELEDFEKEHSLQLTQKELDSLYEIEEKQINAANETLDEKLNNSKYIYEEALRSFQNGDQALLDAMVDWNEKYGDGLKETIIDAWEEAIKALSEYEVLKDESYKGVHIQNVTGYKGQEETYETSVVSGGKKSVEKIEEPVAKEQTVIVEKKETEQPSDSNGSFVLDDTTKRKIAAAIWAGNYGWGNDPDRSKRLTEVFGSDNGIQALVSKGIGANDDPPGAEYTYLNMRKKILGYGYGTGKATAGWHKLDEFGGIETIFESKDGTRYKMFSGGEKVLNATASNFLYEFANNGMSVIEKAMKGVLEGAFREIAGSSVYNEINLGDIIVQGNADRATVSEIRRAQRDALDTMLREMNKLSK